MFSFLKYIQPLWYYRLAFQSVNAGILADLFIQSVIHIERDKRYTSEDAIKMDKVYRALQMGVIPQDKLSLGKSDNIDTITNCNDNYIFVAKYFGTVKLVYVLLLRIICLNNPILELIGFIKAFKVQKIDITLNHCEYEN